MTGKILSPEELRKLTNVVDLMDDGIENGSDLEGGEIRQLPRHSVREATREVHPDRDSKGRTYVLIGGLLATGLVALLATVSFSLPSRDADVDGVNQSCTLARRFGAKRSSAWFDCRVRLATGASVDTLSRVGYPPGTKVTVDASTHAATGVTLYVVTGRSSK